MEDILRELREWCDRRGIDGFKLILEFGDEGAGLQLDDELCAETNRLYSLAKNESLVTPHRRFRFSGIDVEIRD